MHYRERLNIIFMRDNGPRRSITMRRSRFYLLMAFFLCLPFIAILLAMQCWFLWNENSELRKNVEKFEIDYQQAELRAERLENLAELLREENVDSREILLRQIAKDENPPQTIFDLADETQSVIQEGPGHEEYPVIDTGKVKIDNVQVRAMRGHTLRLGLDIRNPQSEALLSGEVAATLVTADGNKKALNLAPKGSSSFRINHYKRAVMTAQTPLNINLVNASVILEIKEQNGEILYQNIYDLQR